VSVRRDVECVERLKRDLRKCSDSKSEPAETEGGSQLQESRISLPSD